MTILEGFRTASAREFALSRFSAFGAFGHQRVLLARRPVRRLFAMPFGIACFIDVAFVTNADQIAPGVVDVEIRYFGFGRGISETSTIHRLFADPISEVRPQRVWLDPPKGAVFAVVSFSRAQRGLKVGLDGRLKLIRATIRPDATQLEQVMETRDLTAMTMVLEALIRASDSQRARQLLGRMIYLGQDASHERMLESLDDAERILKFGPSPSSVGGAASGNGVYRYECCMLERELACLSLGRALKGEARRVSQAMPLAQVSVIEVPAGDMWLGRLLVAAMVVMAVKGLHLKVDLEAFSDAAQDCGPWLKFEKGATFLETNGGKAIQSLIQGI